MVSVHKMPIKNQFLTGIICGFDKTPNQNGLKPIASLSFTGDCTIDFLGKESCLGVNPTLAGTEIVYKTLIKPDA